MLGRGPAPGGLANVGHGVHRPQRSADSAVPRPVAGSASLTAQVFLYVTQVCNIRCVMCYSLDTLSRGDDLSFEDTVRVLAHFRDRGAWKLSLLGGEPTRYRQLPALIRCAHEMGYSFVRIATNGIFNERLLDDPAIHLLDVICFSIDGATADVNDRIRAGGRLSITLRNLDGARRRGYEVRINSTITAWNLAQLFDLIQLAVDHGATEINLNPMVLMGDARRADVPLAIAPEDWRAAYQEVVRRHQEFPLRIKLPPFFAHEDELADHARAGHRCHALDGDRKYVMANGDVFPCLVMMEDSRFREAAYTNGGVQQGSSVLEAGPRLHAHCHFLPALPGELRPLCIFYKHRLNDVPGTLAPKDRPVLPPPRRPAP